MRPTSTKKIINEWWGEVRDLAIAQGADPVKVDRQIAEDRKYTDDKCGAMIAHGEAKDWLRNFLKRLKQPKKRMIAEVVIRGRKVPDFGLGKGVLLQEEITFSDPQGRGFDSNMFKATLLEQEERLMKQAVKVRFRSAGK